jgi:peptide/nickel transport system permease protein
MTSEIEEMILRSYGCFDPLHVRYLKYLYSMFTFGTVPPYFGWSALHNEFVAEGIYRRLPITLFLLGTALVGTMIIGIPVGVFAASKQRTKTDLGLMCSSVFTWGIPSFFFQFIAIFFFGAVLRDTYGIQTFATTWGNIYVSRQEAPLQWWGACLWQLALPTLTLALAGVGTWAFRSRFVLIDALRQDFIITARAKGLSERVVLYKHAFKSVLYQIATIISLSIPGIVTGSFITEYIFGIEGIGQYLIYAIEIGDMEIFILDSAAVQAVFFIFAVIVVLLNFIADLLYGVLDPRIRLGTQR